MVWPLSSDKWKAPQVSTENKSHTYSGGGCNLQVQGLKYQVCSWRKLNDFTTVQTKLKIQ